MKTWVLDRRYYLSGVLGLVVFSVCAHLGGAYAVYQNLGSGFVYKATSLILGIVDLPVRTLYYMAGMGLRFEHVDLSASQLMLDVTILFLINFIVWVGVLLGLRRALLHIIAPHVFGTKT